MELVAKISKGSTMDQIYIPKNRHGLSTGSYVLIKPLETNPQPITYHFYHVSDLEPLKRQLMDQLIAIINRFISSYDNVIFTGSFLEPGFSFNDIDVLLITEHKVPITLLKRHVLHDLHIDLDLLILDSKTLLRGLATDPLYHLMLSKCVTKKRFLYHAKKDMDYKLLDLHLLQSKAMFNNFDILTGNQKYALTRNMTAIALFLEDKKITKETINKAITQTFHLKSISLLQQNILEKQSFLKIYKTTYNSLFQIILRGIQHGSQ